ncbi:MAG: outer membrane protein assembly factor BamD [Bacteroidales bacterium]|jgi:outer membrane protein assembly factor BamD|nr:outer membrane protein assembly factor BamD [Bacteroidales bacterium]MCI2122043.1 outer membrane protein assembly factor BamD [Bacteroidales bacterium]MCI2145340.1 outer membrane protein assembly factor BamD [Bacteroidales bacterium]
MRIKSFIILSVSVLAFISCKTQYDLLLESYDTPAKYAAAFRYFEAKKYSKAAALFESLSLETKNTPQEDTVQFYWALSNYNDGDYVTAESNFDQYIEVFPHTNFSTEAKFLRIDCLYRKTYRYELDQTPTHTALKAIDEYLYEEADSPYRKRCEEMKKDLNERLDRKAYEGAKLYYGMEDYLAAYTALSNVVKDNPDNIYREDVMYYESMAACKYAENSVPMKQKSRYMTFVDTYFNFVGEYPDSHYRKKLDYEYEKAEKYLASKK